MTRLRDMGVEPFLLSSSLLVYWHSGSCAYSIPIKVAHRPSAYECQLHGMDAGKPANHLPATDDGSYTGRTGIYELVAWITYANDDSRWRGEQDLERSRRDHSLSIRADGVRKVLAGTTTLEEVLRATQVD